MQLYVFCWGKFIATLLLSRRVVSHKDFQMPCAKFLISPTILKYIITQTQTSFKKYLSLKHVWPPCLDLRDGDFFSFPFFLSQMGDCTVALSRGLILIILMSTVIVWAASPQHTAPCQWENLALPNSNISLVESQSKEWKNCCHDISQNSYECENRDLKGTQKINGKTCSGFSCTCKYSLSHQQTAEGPVPLYGYQWAPGTASCAGDHPHHLAVCSQRWQPSAKRTFKGKDPLQDSFCKLEAEWSLLWLSGIAVC